MIVRPVEPKKSTLEILEDMQKQLEVEAVELGTVQTIQAYALVVLAKAALLK